MMQIYKKEKDKDGPIRRRHIKKEKIDKINTEKPKTKNVTTRITQRKQPYNENHLKMIEMQKK